MSRLSDAFEHLIATRPPGDPDEVLSGARHRAETARRHRALIGVAGAAAAVVVMVAAVALLTADSAKVVRTGPAGTTSTSGPRTTSVDVFFSPADDSTCTATTGFARQVTADDLPRGAIEALLAGPTSSEIDQGSTSWFSADTEGMLRSVEVVDGTAFVDFENFASIIPTASTSCAGSMLLAQLDASVTQFDDVDMVIYSFDGDAAAFYGWLQMVVPVGARPSPPGGPATDEGYVISGPTGVALVGPDGAVTEITDEAAAQAYAVNTSFVAYQRSEQTPGGAPVGNVRPIMVWAGAEPFELPMGKGTRTVELLDAGPLFGQPTALVAERSGTSPDDTVETLVAIDMVTMERTIIVTREAWESGHRVARLLPDGDVVGLIDIEARTSLARWTSGEDQPVWINDLGVDVAQGLASGSGRLSFVERPIWQEDATTFGIVDIDVATGELDSPMPIALSPLEGSGGAAPPDCNDWWAPNVLVCSVSSGQPVTITLDGSTAELDAPINATASPAR